MKVCLHNNEHPGKQTDEEHGDGRDQDDRHVGLHGLRGRQQPPLRGRLGALPEAAVDHARARAHNLQRGSERAGLALLLTGVRARVGGRVGEGGLAEAGLLLAAVHVLAVPVDLHQGRPLV